ncbi:MAG: HAD family phosphatase [Stappiaceae bacterium]
MPKIEWLVFDLGGVLFNFNGVAGVCTLTGWAHDVAEKLILTSPAVEAFGTGAIDPETFGKLFAAELGVDLTATQMLEHWAEWEAGPKLGAIDYLRELRKTVRLACLTNNNVIHWQRLASRYGADVLFEKCYLSQELRLHKPDPEIFNHVISDLDVPPQSIVYFDDVPENVAAARDCGLNAHLATSPNEIKVIMQQLQL